MARSSGTSCHSDDEDRGVRVFWADQELRRNQGGDFHRHRPKDARDRMNVAANLDPELSDGRFRDRWGWTQAPVAAHGDRSVPSMPLFTILGPEVNNATNIKIYKMFKWEFKIGGVPGDSSDQCTQRLVLMTDFDEIRN